MLSREKISNSRQPVVYVMHYHSHIGTIELSSDGISLTGLHFVNEVDAVDDAIDLAVFRQTSQWLDIYFSGRMTDTTQAPPLRLEGTPFQKKVWSQLLTIPYGKTVTYGAIAKRVGCRSAQAVAGAISRNPVSIIVPCHRVVGADGKLTGYSGGIGRKHSLLCIEDGGLF